MDIELVESENQPIYDSIQNSGNKAGMRMLLKNDHKKGCDNINLDYAGDKIEEESGEVLEELAFLSQGMGNLDNVINEAADLRNVLDMLIYKCEKMKGENK